MRLKACCVAMVVLACGGSRDGRAPARPERTIVTAAFQLAPARESFHCTVTATVLDAPFDVVEIHGTQHHGGHHVALYYTTDPAVQPGPPHECTDEEMVAWRLVGASAESAELNFSLPPGTALQIPAGARLIVQSHYLNEDAAPRTVDDSITIYSTANPAEIRERVDPFVLNDADFRIPPGGEQTRTTECLIEEPTTFYNVLGHGHEWSTRFELRLLRAGASAPETLYDEPGGVMLMFNPPVKRFDTPLVLAPGDRLRMRCAWQNTTDRVLEFPAEMCVALLYYAPASGFKSCGRVIETLGDTVDDSDPGAGQHGCDSPPAPGEPCVRPCDLGNSRGVGKHCTRGGGECAGNGAAIFCTADVDERGPGFCTRPCQDDAACGPEATCVMDTAGSGCVPILCAG